MVQGGFLVGILDVLYPKRCIGCGRMGGYVCPECRATMRVVRPEEAVCPVCQRFAIGGATHTQCRTNATLDGLTSFFHYDRVVRGAVKALKYRFVSDLARELVALVPQSSFKRIPINRRRVIVVPVPLHPARARERGFNQAAALGSVVARKLHLPMRTDILYRTKYSVPQADIKNRSARLHNVTNVFSVRRLSSVRRKSVVVFDDVTTTGATLYEAATVLKRAGASWVWGVAMAH